MGNLGLRRDSLIRKAFSTWRSRPLVWLVLTLAYFPWIFSGQLSDREKALPLSLANSIILGFLLFIVWCYASLAYFVDKGVKAYDVVSRWRQEVSRGVDYFFRLMLRLLAFIFLYSLLCLIPLIPFLIIVLGPWKPGAPVPTLPLMSIAMAGLFLSALLVARIALSPQVAMLSITGQENSARKTMKESIEMVKGGYGRVLSMFMPPLVLFGGLAFLLGVTKPDYAANRWLSLLLIMGIACFDGAIFSFIVAGFSEYFKEMYK